MMQCCWGEEVADERELGQAGACQQLTEELNADIRDRDRVDPAAHSEGKEVDQLRTCQHVQGLWYKRNLEGQGPGENAGHFGSLTELAGMTGGMQLDGVEKDGLAPATEDVVDERGVWQVSRLNTKQDLLDQTGVRDNSCDARDWLVHWGTNGWWDVCVFFLGGGFCSACVCSIATFGCHGSQKRLFPMSERAVI
jgi:hypothetical protein